MAEDPRPTGAKKLVGGSGWRIRIGDYRVVYLVEDTFMVLTVSKIGHRRHVYGRVSTVQKIISISEAKARLAEIVRDSDNDDVVLMEHGHPAAVVLSCARHEALLN